MACIAVFNQKGGVGKTTTVLSLAGMLHREGRPVLAIDLDPQGHLTTACGVEPPALEATAFAIYSRAASASSLEVSTGCGFRLLPANSDLSCVESRFGKGPAVLARLAKSLTLEPAGRPMLLDVSPRLGVLSLSSIVACDSLLVPISADFLAMQAALQMDKVLRALEPVLKRRVRRRYLITRYDARRKLAAVVERELRQTFGAEVCETRISESVSLAESPAYHTDIFSHAPDSRGAQDYASLMQELRQTDFWTPHPDAMAPRVRISVGDKQAMERHKRLLFQSQLAKGLGLVRQRPAQTVSTGHTLNPAPAE
jgi:chromosome partitioning protein